jgi:integrase-like protein
MWLLVPRTKTSIRFGPQETAPGSSSKIPASRCHPLHVPASLCTTDVSIHLYQSELSPPFAKQSRRFVAHEDAPGPAVRASQTAESTVAVAHLRPVTGQAPDRRTKGDPVSRYRFIEAEKVEGRSVHRTCKERYTPLTRQTVRVLRAWFAERGGAPEDLLFPSRHGGRLSPDAFGRFLHSYAAAAARQQRSLAGKTVTPNVLRHTCAMGLLKRGVDTSVTLRPRTA